MESSRATPAYVGIFTIAGLLILFYVSVYTTADETVRNPRQIMVHFPEARGLRLGANVTYQGVRVGIVDSIDLVEVEGRLLAAVSLSVQSNVPIYDNTEISVVAATLLGTMEVAIKAGTPGNPLADLSQPLRGKSPINIEEAVTRAVEGVDSVKQLADNLNRNQGDMFQLIQDVIEENRENIKTATTTFGEAGPRFDAVMSKIEELAQRVAAGEGTMGRLFSDSNDLYDRLDRISQDVDTVTSQLASGEGTLGQLVFSNQGVEDLRRSLDDISAAFNEIRSVIDQNRADIDTAIANLKEVGPSIERAAQNIETVSQRIESGQGTLGLLVNDPGLYEEARGAVTQIRQTLEENEEQTVLQSFFRIFTGGI